MKLLELFSGTKSVSKSFSARGWETYTIDNDKALLADSYDDIGKLSALDILKKFGQPDVIWASPPCTTFSVASLGHHWTGGARGYEPKTPECRTGIDLLLNTIELIRQLKPEYWFIENPRGMMRKMLIMQTLPRYTVTYCQYGDNRMKPTDIWTNHPNPQFKPACKNGDKCHESAPRGSRTGTQGLKGAKARGVIPAELCEHVVNICKEASNETTL